MAIESKQKCPAGYFIMRNKQDILFLGTGIALTGALIIALFYSISFLLLKINTALNIDMSNNNRLIRINLGSLKNIQIMEEAAEEPKIPAIEEESDIKADI
jgi:hypothetical protein